jgi:hypothetical protein
LRHLRTTKTNICVQLVGQALSPGNNPGVVPRAKTWHDLMKGM